MTPESKKNLLAAFDALDAIASGRTTRGARHSHLGCDMCGALLADGSHEPGCPIATAIAAISPLVPPFADRDAWLADNAAPSSPSKPEPAR